MPGTVHERDVVGGGLLGTGGFCEVRCCLAKAKKNMNNNNDMQQQNDAPEAALSDASQLLYDSPISPPPNNSSSSTNNTPHEPMAKYAIKYLSPTRTAPHHSDPKNKVFQRGIADLAVEACFLSLLKHTNIITCHYVSEGSLEENFNADESTAATATTNKGGRGKKGGADNANKGGK